MLWSTFNFNEVILGAHLRLIEREFHNGTTIFYKFCLAVLYKNLKDLVSGFVVSTVPKK